MKKKLTLTIDEELIPRAKRYAREQGVSLSSLVEDRLEELTGPSQPGFVERWRGAFQPACRDDELYGALEARYLASDQDQREDLGQGAES